MFHSRAMEHRINRIHKGSLRLIYSNQTQLKSKENLDKNKTVNIHQRNIQILATKIYKAKTKIFLEVVNCNLRIASILKKEEKFHSPLWK